jgi:hypothetical protein
LLGERLVGEEEIEDEKVVVGVSQRLEEGLAARVSARVDQMEDVGNVGQGTDVSGVRAERGRRVCGDDVEFPTRRGERGVSVRLIRAVGTIDSLVAPAVVGDEDLFPVGLRAVEKRAHLERGR